MRTAGFCNMGFVLFFLVVTPTAGQEIPNAFIQSTDTLFLNRPESYPDIDARLSLYGSDSALLANFAERSESQDYNLGLAYANIKLGSIYRNRSRLEAARAYFQRALDLAITEENPEFQIYSLNRLGEAELATESIKSALDYYQEALNLALKMEDPGVDIQKEISTALNGIGHIYRLLELYEPAIEYFQRSLEYDLALDNFEGQAVNYQSMAESLEALDSVETALEYYKKSQMANFHIGSPRIEAVNQYGMAHVMIHQGELEKAVSMLQTAIPIAETVADREVLSSAYIQMGWALSKLQRFEEARNFLLRGLEISEAYEIYSNVYQANAFLHDIEKTRGNYEAALAYYETAQGARRKVSNDLNRRYVYEFISRSEEDNRLNQIQLLSRENEIVKLQLRRNRTTLLVGALVLILFILILYIIYRQYQLKNERKVMSLEQSMLRSQMNPHFLFNSLNSIKLYIINNEQKNAVHYLNKFSKLVRKILESSSVREIPLEEELDTVKLYMNIENIRFNEQIDFSVEVDPNINPGLVKIPSLILQPFLENALWHGLSSKSGTKKLKVSVGAAGTGFVQIVIEDNGIGRKAAAALQERKVLKRKSVGIANTRERLANFSKDYQNRFEIEIVDLEDADGKPAGTRVILKIPTI